MWVSLKMMIFFIATKAQRHEVSRRKNLREPWCPGVFVAKDILTTKAQRHEVAQRKILVNLGALVPSWHFLCLATKAQRHEATQRKNLSEPWCPCVLVAKNLATKAQRHEAAQRNLVNLSALVSSWRKTNKNENKHIHR